MTDYTKESIFLRAALVYARRGWHVFPLGMRSKKPLTDNGVLDATTDEAQIRAWWTANPSANIGIATGRSGLVVLDFDDPQQAAWTFYGEPVPSTVTARTPSGGTHLLFKYDGDDIAPAQNIFPDGLKTDLRAANSYIVAAPSIHPDTGTAYRWDKDAHPARTELAELPDDLAEYLRAKPWAVSLDRPATNADDEPELVTDGQDEYGARRAAQLARKGFSKDEARAALGAMIETRFAGGWAGLDARRPWKAKDVERWIEGAYAKFYDPEGGEPTDSERIADLMGAAMLTAGAATPNVTQGAINRVAPRERDKGITADDLQGREFKPIKWVINDLLPEGASILGGKPKVGKSWLVLGLAASVAAGEYALGELPVAKGEVVYLALEDGRRRLQRRLRQMLGNKPWPKGLTFFTEWPRVDQGGIEELDQWLTDHPKTQLLVIDTLKHIRAPESAKLQGYGADYEAVTPLQHLATKHGIAILIVTHLRKLDADDPLDTVQGTMGISGGVDGIYVFKRPKGSLEGTLYYRGRDIEEGEKVLVWKPGETMLWRLKDAAEAPKPGDAILDAIKPGETVSPKQLADLLGYPADTVRKRLERLAETGQVVKIAHGTYTLPAPVDAF